MLSRIRQELSTFQRSEKLFVLFSMLICFSIGSEYGITRPASNALFLTHFSASLFPYVWLATVPLNLLVVTCYNRFLPRIGPWKMMCLIATCIIGTNLSVTFFAKTFPPLLFFQFAWKDIYILLMFKQLWSMIHTTIPSSRAKYLYGLIFASGTCGSILSSLIPSFFAVRLGSEQLFYFTLPLYLGILFFYRNALAKSAVSHTSFAEKLQTEEKPREGFSLIFRSPYLIAVLSIVVFMQISVGLMEYQFNSHLEQEIGTKDLRTEYMGRLIFIMNLLSGGLQLIGSFLMIRAIGVRNSHLIVPLVLLANALTLAAFPSFALLSCAFVLIKGIDFSLFGIIREMLYIPMQLDEKFRAKAVIDVFAYRTSKALVSLCIIALQLFAATALLSYVSVLSIAIFTLWILVVWFSLRKRYRESGATL